MSITPMAIATSITIPTPATANLNRSKRRAIRWKVDGGGLAATVLMVGGARNRKLPGILDD
jgi:hypothetical protein